MIWHVFRVAVGTMNPYLLRGVRVKRPDHVWSTDITYIRMIRGFLYLCAVVDWGSRVKYEHVLLHEYQNGIDLQKGLAQYFHGFVA